MCLVLTNPVEILAVQHVKQGMEAGGFCTGHPSKSQETLLVLT